jgi:intraflagellar transport protein 56
VVAATAAQQGGPQAAELLRTAQQCFQLVGASSSECDTIPGRQCMASAHFLMGQFEDVLVFLEVGGRGY